LQSIDIHGVGRAGQGQHARARCRQHIDGPDVRRIFRNHGFAPRDQQSADQADGLLGAVGDENFFIARG
jgi:hypothetical protein